MAHNALVRHLAARPRLAGALFTAAILLVQVGPVLAGNDGGTCANCAGP